jgi:glyoxylase-like metal-dependent hydrolase (beta-lactamase superfamily II)
MSYHGHVSPGGPPAVRELTELVLSKVSVGPMDNNAYLLRCRATGAQLLVDAAAEPQRLLGLVGGEGALQQVVTTHRHRDHWGALAAVVHATDAVTIAHPDDAPGIEVPTRRPVEAGDQVTVGEVALEVIHLVGHTPGSIALLYDDPHGTPHLFTGDSLFPGGVGKTTSPTAFASLLRDVERKIFDRLPDETWVYPGHGDDTVLGRERPALPQWWARGW